MEVLANIRAHPAITGLCLPESVPNLPVLSLYDDDTTVISTSEVATVAVFAHLEGTGSKLNMDNCEGLWLGSWCN